MKPTTPRYARYSSAIYLVSDRTNTHTILKHPYSSGIEPVNIALNGEPILIPGIVRLENRDVDLFKDDAPVQPLPPAPTDSNRLEIGSRCQWGTSLGVWAITAINGELATIHQTSGWAMATPFTAPLSELSKI